MWEWARRNLARLRGNTTPPAQPAAPATPPAKKPKPRLKNDIPRPRAKYDAAQRDTENDKLWRDADGLSARAANDPGTRAKLRNRSRYEEANNGYVGGLVNGRANDTIGCGPRLQLTIPPTDDSDEAIDAAADLARQVELLYLEWSEAIGYPDKLWLMDATETRDGEVFALYVSNPALDGMPQLDFVPLEADQVTSPDQRPDQPVDGIRLDALGNPAAYDVLDRHPGDSGLMSLTPLSYQTYPARQVVHLFHRKRPGQCRGVPPLTPGLPLFGQLRQLRASTLGAARLSAMLAAFLTQEHAPAGSGAEATEVDAMDQIPFAPNVLLTLGAGQGIETITPTQPGPNFKEFNSEVLTEAGRPINASRNISTGSSAEYNYSSGRLDHLPWQTGGRIRRDRWRRHLLDRTYREWLAEAQAIPGYLPAGLPDAKTWRVSWQWDGWPSIDPVKDATAAEIRLRSGQSTLERECAERGDDWEEVMQQQAREMRKRKRLGLPVPGAAPMPAATMPAEQKPNDEQGGVEDV